MSEQIYNETGQQLTEEFGVEMGQMFGTPSLKKNRKAFAAYSQGGMAFKLGQQEVNLLQQKFIGAVNWDPSGKKRPMKDWLLVPAEYQENWKELAVQALEFIQS